MKPMRYVYILRDACNEDPYTVGHYTTLRLAKKAAMALIKSKLFWDKDNMFPLSARTDTANTVFEITREPLNEIPH